MNDPRGCCHGFPDQLAQHRPQPAGAALRLRRPFARRPACGAGAGPAVDGQQRGADRAEPHRHVVHGAHLHQGARGGGRGAVAGDRGGAGARRRRHRGADTGGAKLRRAALPPRQRGGVDRAVRDGVRRAAVRAARSRAAPDSRALRLRSRHRAARGGLLVPARRRRVCRGRGVGDARLFQRHRPAAHDARDYPRDHGHQRAAQPAVHLQARLGHPGPRGRPTPRNSWDSGSRSASFSNPITGGVTARTSPGGRTLGGCSRSCASACRWACRRLPTCWGLRSSR